jgi:ribonuclease HI
MTFDPHALKIYIDGSSYKNPGGASGYAGVAEYPSDWNLPDKTVFTVGYQASTNNRMELLACITAVEFVRDNIVGLKIQRVQIVTDSRYVHDNIPRLEEWRRNKWKNRYGRPIENDNLWKRFLTLRHAKLGLRIDFEWKKGKKSPILKAVDAAAKAAAHQPWERDFGFRGGKVGRSKVKSARASAILFPASGQEAIIHVYRSRLVGGEGKIDFDVYSEAKREFEQKCTGYARLELSAELHRGHVYRVRFNENPQYPVIEEIKLEILKETLEVPAS